jgi:hypothetical protein
MFVMVQMKLMAPIDAAPEKVKAEDINQQLP